MNSPSESEQKNLQAYHERHMDDGQDCYFELQDGRLTARPEQIHWLAAHRQKTRRLLNLQPTDDFVDMGCGEGYLTLPLVTQARHSLGLDFVTSPLAVLKAQPDYNDARLSLAVAAGDALPLSDACVDKLLCNHVLEHVWDDDAVVQEFHRILRPGGLVLIGVPLALSPQVRLLIRARRILRPKARQFQLEQVRPGKLVPELIGVQSHIRFYSLSAVNELLERNGFAVLRAEGIGFSMRGGFSKRVRRSRWLFGLTIAIGNFLPSMGDGALVLGRRI